jgi:DDE family transposase
MPMAVVVAGANRHEMKLLADTLDAVVIARPAPTEAAPQHVCLDQGDDDDACRQEAEGQGYIPHLRSRGEERQETREIPAYRPRRWVVERRHSEYPYPDTCLLSDDWPDRIVESRHRRGKVPASGRGRERELMSPHVRPPRP